MSGKGIETNKFFQTTSNTATDTRRGVILDVNMDTKQYGNLMAGHANEEEIRPFSIALLPLISY